MDWKGQGGYLTHLDFAAMVAADARHCPFSLLTDFMFTRFNAIGSATHIKSVDFAGVSSVPISRSSQTSVGTTLDTTIWTLAGGYTLLQGDWGNLDLLAGFRLLALNARTDFSLALTLTPPHGNGATFGGAGRSISGSQDVWNGIGGIRGNICLGTLRCFVPHYFDIGAVALSSPGESRQGLAISFTGSRVSQLPLPVIQAGGSALIRHMSMGGLLLMTSFSF